MEDDGLDTKINAQHMNRKMRRVKAREERRQRQPLAIVFLQPKDEDKTVSHTHRDGGKVGTRWTTR